MKGKLISMAMALCMIAAAAGCGSAGKTSTASSEADSSQTPGTAAASSEGTEASESGEVSADATQEDIADINMVIVSMSSIPTGLQAVEDAINEITEAEIGTHVNIEMIEVAAMISKSD